MKYIEKNAIFCTKFRFKIEQTREIKKKNLINYINMGIVFILLRKKMAVTIEILKRGYL